MSRRVLLDHAERLVRRDPDFTMEALADAAGVSRTTVYRRFESRSALVEALAAERGAPVPPAMREQILNGAVAAFTELGLSGATMERIAEAAGVAPVTIYRHFGDKEALLLAVLEERSPRRLVESLPLEGCELAADLERVARAGLEFLWEHRGLLRLALAPDPQTEAFLARMRRASGGTRRALARYLEVAWPECGDARDQAERFFALMVGLGFVMPVLDGTGPPDVPHTARRIVDTLLQGAKGRRR